MEWATLWAVLGEGLYPTSTLGPRSFHPRRQGLVFQDSSHSFSSPQHIHKDQFMSAPIFFCIMVHINSWKFWIFFFKGQIHSSQHSLVNLTPKTPYSPLPPFTSGIQDRGFQILQCRVPLPVWTSTIFLVWANTLLHARPGFVRILFST